MNGDQNLGFLKKGQVAVISCILPSCKNEIRQRLLDLGFVKGAEIRVQNISPLNDPIAYNIHNTLISLRMEDAANVLVEIKK